MFPAACPAANAETDHCVSQTSRRSLRSSLNSLQDLNWMRAAYTRVKIDSQSNTHPYYLTLRSRALKSHRLGILGWLMSVPYETAIRTSVRNKFARFPDRNSGRLEPIAQPSFDTGLKLNQGDTIVTMGSCFARNIEEFLASAGYDVPVLDYQARIEETSGRASSAGHTEQIYRGLHLSEVLWGLRRESNRMATSHGI